MAQSITSSLLCASHLPKDIPLFLIRGAVLLPKAQLPLPLFNSNHISMVASAMKNGGYIGLIQPNMHEDNQIDLDDISLFSTGTLGRITEISEIEEKRMVVNIEGVNRFSLIDRFDGPDGYPIARVSYDQFTTDLADELDFAIDRRRLESALKNYFTRLEIRPNWEEINKISNHKLINALAMACPFGASEKQALLETHSIKSQSDLILTLIEMASLSGQNDNGTFH